MAETSINMRLYRLLPVFLFLLFAFQLTAQSAKDVTLPVKTELDSNGLDIVLSWPMPNTGNIQIIGRVKGQNGSAWVQIASLNATTVNTVTITGTTLGLTYEFRVQRVINNLTAYGYVMVGVNAPAVVNRGRIMLCIDSTLLDPLAAELQRLRTDLIGDGWVIVERHAGPSATVASVKAAIQSDYIANYTGQQAVFLLGAIPIPYSGNSAWDGHPEHNGAWPADSYYADVTGTWTDATVNSPTPGRTANRNIPGDGKFDQSYLPSAAELAIGRVDFRRINASAFGAANTIALYRRYLNKDHAWRSGSYRAENRALVDDNFGYFSGEAFAANGWRNAYPLVGESAVDIADFFNNTDTVNYLMTYGTGGGTYTSASGVGNSSNFASDSVNAVFSMLFGSYFGDWDYENNPFMPSALASKSAILTCSWAGRPHHFLHPLAAGETIGFAMLETINAVQNNGYHPTSGESGAHISLLGDPTLRAHIVAPPQQVSVVNTCEGTRISWSPPADSSIAGYHIYYASAFEGPYQLFNSTPITDTFFDPAGYSGNFFQVRSTRLESVYGGGRYWNTSTGVLTGKIDYEEPLIAYNAFFTQDCSTDSVRIQVVSNFQDITYAWSGPNGFISSEPNPWVTDTGFYSVTLTRISTGCSFNANVWVDAPPVFQIGITLSDQPLTCIDTCLQIDLSEYGIEAPQLSICDPGIYQLTGLFSQSGCPVMVSLTVMEQSLPQIQLTPDTTTDCVGLVFVDLITVAGKPPYSILWSDGSTNTWGKLPPNTAFSLTVTDASGCSTIGSGMTPQVDFTPLSALVSGQDATSASADDGSLFATYAGGTPPFSVQWTGGTEPIYTDTVNQVSPGTYNFLVTDAKGCTATGTVVVGISSSVFSTTHEAVIRLVPNPAVSQSELFFTSAMFLPDRVKAYSSGGKLIFERNWVQNASATTLDVSKWPPGIYTIVISGPTFTAAHRLAVVR